ncbi:cytidylate kinase [Nematocida displodere]|uniref:(d)CMP kinase n=1 Tax=Nematocida displodere TaxID=1805483 RepID=A0A177ECN6_9MICR|nr:cytidylate kinase [Nematocida displodere]
MQMAASRRKSPFRIAIDGPAGAGKSTLAEALAHDLSFTHINTGVIYRALSFTLIGWVGGFKNFDLLSSLLGREDPEIYAEVERFSPEIAGDEVFLKQENVTLHLRTPEIDSVVGIIAKYPGVRKKIGELQRKLINTHSVPGVVVEGRDIGTVIIPDAELKIFLIASVHVRAQRRAQENQTNNVQEIEKEMEERDRLDRTRETSPLVQAPDAIVIDNSALSIASTIATIKAIVARRWAE